MPWFLPLCEMLITGEKIRCSLAAWRQRADHHSYIDTCLTINCWAGAAWPHAWTIPQSGRVMNSRDTWLASAGGLHIASVQPSCIWFFFLLLSFSLFHYYRFAGENSWSTIPRFSEFSVWGTSWLEAWSCSSVFLFKFVRRDRIWRERCGPRWIDGCPHSAVYTRRGFCTTTGR